jgi:16S rRNA (guanine527-N7)-methyltransferase
MGGMEASEALVGALERARRLGVLGPGPVQEHVAHAQGFVDALAGVPVGSLVVDLGSGGGVPGLVVAEARPDLRLVLLDAMEKRTALLSEAVVAMGKADRITVRTGRAEVLGREDTLRGAAMAVMARSFGPPAATAECAAPLLAVGGALVVSEPPDSPDRWPTGPLKALGLSPAALHVPGMMILTQTSACPETYPRRTGLPTKRPLF